MARKIKTFQISEGMQEKIEYLVEAYKETARQQNIPEGVITEAVIIRIAIENMYKEEVEIRRFHA